MAASADENGRLRPASQARLTVSPPRAATGRSGTSPALPRFRDAGQEEAGHGDAARARAVSYVVLDVVACAPVIQDQGSRLTDQLASNIRE